MQILVLEYVYIWAHNYHFASSNSRAGKSERVSWVGNVV